MIALLLSLFAMLVPFQPPCVEDDACWDCHTMGNQICGTP